MQFAGLPYSIIAGCLAGTNITSTTNEFRILQGSAVTFSDAVDKFAVTYATLLHDYALNVTNIG